MIYVVTLKHGYYYYSHFFHCNPRASSRSQKLPECHLQSAAEKWLSLSSLSCFDLSDNKRRLETSFVSFHHPAFIMSPLLHPPPPQTQPPGYQIHTASGGGVHVCSFSTPSGATWLAYYLGGFICMCPAGGACQMVGVGGFKGQKQTAEAS